MTMGFWGSSGFFQKPRCPSDTREPGETREPDWGTLTAISGGGGGASGAPDAAAGGGGGVAVSLACL